MATFTPIRRFSGNSGEDSMNTLAATLAKALQMINTTQQAKYKAYTSYGNAGSLQRHPTADVRSFFTERVTEPIHEAHLQPRDVAIPFLTAAQLKRLHVSQVATMTAAALSKQTTLTVDAPTITTPISLTPSASVTIPITEEACPSTLSMLSEDVDDDVTLTAAEEDAQADPANSDELSCDSTKRKRYRKMNRHKYKKRIKRERHMNRKNTAQ